MAETHIDCRVSNCTQAAIIPNVSKSADAHPDYRVMTQGIEIGAGWTKKGETSGKEYVILALAATAFDPKKFYANLGHVAGQIMQLYSSFSLGPCS